MTKIVFILVMTAVSSVAFGQGHHPYAGLEQRAVKALSEQQIADLKAGRGMGLALPAELNGYPGPSHVLENADALGLNAEQRDRTKALFESMKAEAVPVGERLIEQEAKLGAHRVGHFLGDHGQPGGQRVAGAQGPGQQVDRFGKLLLELDHPAVAGHLHEGIRHEPSEDTGRKTNEG